MTKTITVVKFSKNSVTYSPWCDEAKRIYIEKKRDYLKKEQLDELEKVYGVKVVIKNHRLGLEEIKEDGTYHQLRYRFDTKIWIGQFKDHNDELMEPIFYSPSINGIRKELLNYLYVVVNHHINSTSEDYICSENHYNPIT